MFLFKLMKSGSRALSLTVTLFETGNFLKNNVPMMHDVTFSSLV